MPPVVTISWRRCRRGAYVERGESSRTVMIGSVGGVLRVQGTRTRPRWGVLARADVLAQPTRGGTAAARARAMRMPITVARVTRPAHLDPAPEPETRVEPRANPEMWRDDDAPRGGSRGARRGVLATTGARSAGCPRPPGAGPRTAAPRASGTSSR